MSNKPGKITPRKATGGRPRTRSVAKVIAEAEALVPSAIAVVKAILADPTTEPHHRLRAAALVLEHASRVPEGPEEPGEKRVTVVYEDAWSPSTGAESPEGHA